jgi:hypothetical protein
MGKVDERKRRKARKRLELQKRRQSAVELEAEIRPDLQESWHRDVPKMTPQERVEAYQEIVADAHKEIADAQREHGEPMQWARDVLAGTDFRLRLLAEHLDVTPPASLTE